MAIANKTMQVGQEIPSVRKEVTLDRMRLYTQWTERNMHTDWEWAEKAGVPAPVAQGLMPSTYISEMLTAFLGENWLKGGKLLVKFIAYTLPMDTLTARGFIKEVAPEGDGVRLTMEVWCENQHGNKVTVGTASAVIY